MWRRFSSAIVPSRSKRTGEEGASLAALLASLTVMLIGLAAAAPTWHYVVANDREQELLWRGLEIVRALRTYQSRQGGTLPDSLEKLVQFRFLRKEYKDPIFVEPTKFHIIRRGIPEESCAEPPQPPEGQEGGQEQQPPPSRGAAPPPGNQRGSGGETPVAGVVAEMIGVRSTSEDESYRVYIGRNHYNEWCFTIDHIGQNIMTIEEMTWVQPGGEVPEFTGTYKDLYKRDWTDRPPLKR